MNPLSEIQNKPNTAASTSGYGVLADEIVSSTPAGVTIEKLNSTDIQTDSIQTSDVVTNTIQVNTQLESNGKAIFSSIRIPEWQPNYYYQIGEIFRRGHSIYFVEITHTSQASSENFYIDWLVNKNVRPMGRHPGQIVNLINAGSDPGSNALPADGAEYDIAGKEDLFRYLNYGFTPTTVTFTQADVVNSGGFIQINRTNHGFYEGQVVEVIKGAGGGSFSNTSQTLFVRRIDANSFQLSIIAHTQVTVGTTPIVFSGTPFLGNGHSVVSRLWGVASSSAKFRVPDFRGLLLANSGTNGLIRKYGNGNYTKEYGAYMYDKGLWHRHYQNDGNSARHPSFINQVGPGNGFNGLTSGPVEARANEDEFSPAHAVVNCYILY